MTKVKTSKLTGIALDWVVAKCEGYEVMLFDTLWRDNAAAKGYLTADVEQHLQWQHQKGMYVIVELRQLCLDQRNPENTTPTRCAKDIPNYSTDWSQGGPIIERERISVVSDFHEIKEGWLAENYQGNIQQFGSTPLIAAMRCYVASRLGDEVDVPEELS